MNQKKIETQKELDQIIESIDWVHSFIREVYALSPSYREDEWEVNPDSLPSLKILIISMANDLPGIELFFSEVEEISISFDIYFNPSGIIDKDGIQFFFTSNKNKLIQAKSLTVNIYDKSCWGWDTIYGKENFFDSEIYKAED
jgi:hypothetical protein